MWSFLTGPPEQVKKASAAWGMWARPTANGQLDHPSRIFLVDGQQRIREIYDTDLLKVEDVRQDVRDLVGKLAARHDFDVVGAGRGVSPGTGNDLQNSLPSRAGVPSNCSPMTNTGPSSPILPSNAPVFWPTPTAPRKPLGVVV